MLKLLLSLYFISYFCYIFYTRTPDYFDGETSNAVITINPITKNAIANFKISAVDFNIDASYPLRKLKQGDKVEVIYLPSNPQTAAVYRFWGYWITWGELLMSVILLLGLYQLAVSITYNPTEAAVLDQMDKEEMPKTKYD